MLGWGLVQIILTICLINSLSHSSSSKLGDNGKKKVISHWHEAHSAVYLVLSKSYNVTFYLTLRTLCNTVITIFNI